jgi:hypothetical protein
VCISSCSFADSDASRCIMPMPSNLQTVTSLVNSYFYEKKKKKSAVAIQRAVNVQHGIAESQPGSGLKPQEY